MELESNIILTIHQIIQKAFSNCVEVFPRIEERVELLSAFREAWPPVTLSRLAIN